MRPTQSILTRISAHLSLLLPLLLCGSPATAQITNTWTGLGADSNWSTPGNWDAAGVPASAATTGLDFTGSAATANNDLGTLQLNVMQFDVASDLILSGNDLDFVANPGSGSLPVLIQNSNFGVTMNNNLTLTDNLTLNMTGNTAGCGNINLTGAITGGGSLTLSAGNGAYTTILSNANNSYSGGTFVAGGTLQLGADNALPTGNDLTLTGTAAAATLDLNGHAVTVGNINFGDGTTNSVNSAVITDSSPGSTALLTLNGNLTYNPGPNPTTPTAYLNTNLVLSGGQHVIDNSGNGNFSYQNYDLIVGGSVSGSGGLDIGSVNDVSGGIYAALAHANTYAGPTNIINGNLYLGATNALPLQGAVTVGRTGNLYLYIASDYTEAGLNSGSYNQTIGSLGDAGNFGGGNIFLGGATLTVGSNNTSTTFSGSIQDNDGSTHDPTAVGGSLVKTGTGVLTLSGQSGYTGSTIINAGTLQLGSSDALPDTNNGAIINTNLTLNGGTFDTNNNSQTLNNVTNQGGNVLIRGGNSTVTVNGAYTQSKGTTQVDGTLNVTPGQDLSLTGGLLIGTVAIGNATGSGTATVTNSGGTVKPGDVLSSNGTLLSVATTGTLAIQGNYTQGSGGTLEIDLGGTDQGTTYDLLRVSGNADLAGTLDVKVLPGFTPTQNEQFNFLTYGTLNGEFDTIVGLLPGYTYSVSYANGVGTLVVAGVPESSSLLSSLLILSLGGMALRRVRRNV